MGVLNQLLHALLAVLSAIAALVLAGLTWLETALATPMRAAGFPPLAREVVGIAVAVLFLLAALRLFGGLIRVTLIVFLLVLVVHVLASHGGPALTHTGGIRT
jgi:putative exporter of polyketide antibiotics